ncbi:transposase [Pandoraea horticolens]|uniref:Transposase n=1 Tax=Pandoraea horticolens TaxID=2508298 RepID=A0A5E4YCW5_9BURK|nr:transposase [Pandoraea horticolens]
MKNPKSLYHGRRFPAAVISCSVRRHFRFQLSLRGIEEWLFERGIVVSYETVRRWCDKFGARFAHRVKAAARVNNRAENSHQPARERERRMRGFRDPERTQVFLSSFGPIRQHFALKRHLLRASLYRKQLCERFVVWHQFTELTQGPSSVRQLVASFALVRRTIVNVTTPFEALEGRRA